MSINKSFTIHFATINTPIFQMYSLKFSYLQYTLLLLIHDMLAVKTVESVDLQYTLLLLILFFSPVTQKFVPNLQYTLLLLIRLILWLFFTFLTDLQYTLLLLIQNVPYAIEVQLTIYNTLCYY